MTSTPSTPRSERRLAALVACGAMLLLGSACSGRTAAADDDRPVASAARPDWSGRGRFCSAAAEFEVGRPNPRLHERTHILHHMRANAPQKWQGLLDGVIEELDSGAGTEPDAETFDEFTEFVERGCDLNLPQP